jgi:hypothetical protein
VKQSNTAALKFPRLRYEKVLELNTLLNRLTKNNYNGMIHTGNAMS